MSTDSTELTFVRCPACRSLVPAVSTRCRMCGATLDAAAQKVDEPPRDSPKSGRVRQRTTSVSGSDLSAAAGLIRQEMAGEAGASALGASSEAEGVGSSEHELEESSAAELSAAESSAGVSSTVVSSASEAGLFSGAASSGEPEGDDDPLSAYIQEIDSEEPATNGNSASHAEEARPLAAEKPSQAVAPEAKPTEPRASEAQPRVIIETGPRKANKPSNLSFGSGRSREEEPKAASASGEESGWTQVPSPRENGPRDRQNRGVGAPASGGAAREARNDSRQEQRRPEQGRPEQNRAEQGRAPQGSPRQDEGRGGQARGEQRPDQRPDRSSSSQGSAASQGARRPDSREPRQGEQRHSEQRHSEQRHTEQRQGDQRQGRESHGNVEFAQAQTGRLVGWLVSYTDPRGSASELREGRFFFTGAPLKPHDVVLDDPSISTPHALVAVGVGEGLRVQDLMSDRGVWVKRTGQEAFQRVTDAVKIEHGDWLRLGEIEFMVCLITAPGAK